MADDLRERLLASYAHMGEAMVAQNVLEAGGVPCRVGDLAQVPAHVFGIAGALGRSTGVWVLEADVERARALLDTLETAGGGVDEEALAEEALAAAAPGAEVGGDAQGVAPRAPLAVRGATGSPWPVRAAGLLVAVVVLALIERRCG